MAAREVHSERPEDSFFAQATTDAQKPTDAQATTDAQKTNDAQATTDAHPTTGNHATQSAQHDTVENPANDSTRVDTESAESSTRSVRVKPGDSLWLIAQESLPIDSTRAEIANLWHQIYALNKEAIGSDPNLIRTGTTLRLPAASQDA